MADTPGTQYYAFVLAPRTLGGEVQVVYTLHAYTPGVEYTTYIVTQAFFERRLHRPITGRTTDPTPPVVMTLQERGEVYVESLAEYRADAAEQGKDFTSADLEEMFQERLEMTREKQYPISFVDLPGGGYPPFAFMRKARMTRPRVLSEDEMEAAVEHLSGAGAYHHD